MSVSTCLSVDSGFLLPDKVCWALSSLVVKGLIFSLSSCQSQWFSNCLASHAQTTVKTEEQGATNDAGGQLKNQTSD